MKLQEVFVRYRIFSKQMVRMLYGNNAKWENYLGFKIIFSFNYGCRNAGT
jgi:hypothetical protein